MTRETGRRVSQWVQERVLTNNLLRERRDTTSKRAPVREETPPTPVEEADEDEDSEDTPTSPR